MKLVTVAQHVASRRDLCYMFTLLFTSTLKKKKKKKKGGTLLRGPDLGPRHKDIGEIEKLL